MGGRDGARGYLIQALICVLDGLDDNHHWVSVSIEPNNESEQIDIEWRYANSRKLVQVKSSRNQIDLPSVKRWAAALENSSTADVYELRLLGPCSASVARVGIVENVRIPTPEILNLDSLVEQAAHKLDRYLTSQHAVRNSDPFIRELVVAALSQRLGMLSTQGTSLSRNDLNLQLAKWVQDTSEKLETIPPTLTEVDLDSYRRRFREYHRQRLSPLVPIDCKIDGVTRPSTELLGFICQGHHAQIIGPSGYGKSHLARYMALTATEAGRILIFTRAIEYAGDINSILDRGVSAFYSCTASALLSQGFESGCGVAIVVDGFNECPIAMQECLLFDLQACYLRWKAPIILTSQDLQTVPPELSGPIIAVCELNDTQRHEILRIYSRNELPLHATTLCRPFNSAFELSVAATCIDEIAECPNRAGLFDIYIASRMREKVDVRIARRVLAAVAGVMRIKLQSSLALVEIERVGEAVLDEQRVSVTNLQSILNTGILQVQQGIGTFQHELLQRYFEAWELRRSTSQLETLIAQLLRPVHHALIEFVLGLERDAPRFMAILRATAKVRRTSELISAVLRNEFGWGMSIALKDDISNLFLIASEELQLVTVAINTVGSKEERRQTLDISGQRVWTSYEHALWNHVTGQLSRGDFLNESLQLVAETERLIFSRVRSLVGAAVAEKASAK